MTKKIIFLAFFSFFFVECNSYRKNILGQTYSSACYLQGLSEAYLTINPNETFEYKLRFIDKKITGQIEKKKDTLILSSNTFRLPIKDSILITYKYTRYSMLKDAYVIKRNKLYRIDSLGNIDKNCYLVRHVD